jgi:hypothetical protein
MKQRNRFARITRSNANDFFPGFFFRIYSCDSRVSIFVINKFVSIRLPRVATLPELAREAWVALRGSPKI